LDSIKAADLEGGKKGSEFVSREKRRGDGKVDKMLVFYWKSQA